MMARLFRNAWVVSALAVIGNAGANPPFRVLNVNPLFTRLTPFTPFSVLNVLNPVAAGFSVLTPKLPVVEPFTRNGLMPGFAWKKRVLSTFAVGLDEIVLPLKGSMITRGCWNPLIGS